jgi:hypothetical protein
MTGWCSGGHRQGQRFFEQDPHLDGTVGVLQSGSGRHGHGGAADSDLCQPQTDQATGRRQGNDPSEAGPGPVDAGQRPKTRIREMATDRIVDHPGAL